MTTFMWSGRGAGEGEREQHLLPASSHLPGWWGQIFAIGKVLKASDLEATGVKVRGGKAGSWAGQMSRRGKGQDVPGQGSMAESS